MNDSPRIVLVTGARGMVGSAVVSRLLSDGHGVRALVRAHSSSPLVPAHPRLDTISGDVRDTDAMREIVAGCDAVVHCAAAKNDERFSYAVNVLGTQNVVMASQRAGCESFIHVSTQSARLQRRGLYGETKRQSEGIVRDCTVSATILRPSIVYRDFETGILGSIARYLRLPRVPVIGSGTAIYQPIHSDDLAAVIANGVRCASSRGRTYDIGGPTPLNFVEMVVRVAEALGRKARTFHIPPWFAMTVARVGEYVGVRPITKSNVLGAIQSRPMDTGPMITDFAVDVRSFAEGLECALGRGKERSGAPGPRIATHA